MGKGGIGVASTTKTRPSESSPSSSAATSKPTASELLAVKLRRKETSTVSHTRASVREAPLAPMRCSTTDDELEALFSAIDKEITDDPEAAVDLLDIIEDRNDEEMPEDIVEEMEVIRSNIYLPPEDDYEMMVEETEEEEAEDAEMREMMEMIEKAKGEIESSKQEELVKMMDKIDDDEYFEKMKDDIKQSEMKNTVALKDDTVVLEEPSHTKVEDNDANKNKRRADEAVPEKEPSKKKTKDNKKKKVLAAGGVSMFGGKDLFGGMNPFASRKQEQSSEEEDELASDEEKPSTTSNGDHGSGGMLPPPPPPQMPSFNIAVQADSEEQPVSFDDLPSSTHFILSSNKHRAK